LNTQELQVVFIDQYGYPYCRGAFKTEKDMGQYDDEIKYFTGERLLL
jgi:hypothetical protein